MSRKLSPGEEHLNRNDRFRFEEDVVDEQAAFEKAAARSLLSNKVIFVTQNTSSKVYTINSHGIDLIGYQTVAKFYRGNKIQ